MPSMLSELSIQVRQILCDMFPYLEDYLDPDAGKTLHPEIVETLRRYQAERPTGIPLEAVIAELGLKLD
jgi:hypothetical protein